REAGGKKRARQVDGTGELIRLYPHETDQDAPTLLAHHADDLVGPHPPVGFIIGVQADFDPLAKHMAGTRLIGPPTEASASIGWDRRAQPLNWIAVVVVMGRLDHHEVKQRRGGAGRALNPHPASFA